MDRDQLEQAFSRQMGKAFPESPPDPVLAELDADVAGFVHSVIGKSQPMSTTEAKLCQQYLQSLDMLPASLPPLVSAYFAGWREILDSLP